MSTPWKFHITVNAGDNTHEVDLEFTGRPTGDELGVRLAQFFNKMNYNFDEHLFEVRECVLLTPRRNNESSVD